MKVKFFVLRSSRSWRADLKEVEVDLPYLPSIGQSVSLDGDNEFSIQQVMLDLSTPEPTGLVALGDY